MAGYGSTAQSYGYYKPPPQRRAPSRQLALAAAGHPSPQDPFGLLTDTTDSARAARQNATPHTAARTVVAPAAHPATTVAPPAADPTAPPAPPTTPGYDVNTDVALQQTNSLLGYNDEQARAAALQQKKDLLLGYGDSGLAAAALGANDPTVDAAANNPFSTRKNLQTQRDRNVTNLTEGLNKDNLLYSGYRINQEEQAAHDFQDALAQAAAGANSGLSGIDAQLAAALGQSNLYRSQAITSAYDRHKTDPGATDPGAGGGDGGGDGGGNITTTVPGLQLAEDPLQALMLAAAKRRTPVTGNF